MIERHFDGEGLRLISNLYCFVVPTSLVVCAPGQNLLRFSIRREIGIFAPRLLITPHSTAKIILSEYAESFRTAGSRIFFQLPNREKKLERAGLEPGSSFSQPL